MRRLGLLLASSVLALSCQREAPSSPGAPAVASISPAPSVAQPATASPAPLAPCAHRRPFSEKEPLVLPEPFAAFDACDVLGAITADYDRATEKSASLGGTVRIDGVRRWDTRGRSLLAVTFYQGQDAEAEFICGQCRVWPGIAVVERRGPRLALVGKRLDLWHPTPDVIALFDGRAELDPTRYPFDEDEELLGVRVPWSTGMPGTWRQLALVRLDGETPTIVFEQQVNWSASGMGTEDDDEVDSRVSVEPRPDGPNDIVLVTTELRCRQDTSGAQPKVKCKAPQKLGKQRWRFDGAAYRRIEGQAPPLPKVLKKLWGW